MIIRSQDKKRIANINTCNLIAIVGTQGKSKNITVDGMVIGEYSTEEKAIKVLDMIQDAYARCESTIALTTGTAFEVAKCKGSQENVEEYRDLHRANFVFLMPADEDVEV